MTKQSRQLTTKTETIIYCPGCNAPVSETKFGVRSHLIRMPQCSGPMHTIGYDSEGNTVPIPKYPTRYGKPYKEAHISKDKQGNISALVFYGSEYLS